MPEKFNDRDLRRARETVARQLARQLTGGIPEDLVQDVAETELSYRKAQQNYAAAIGKAASAAMYRRS